MTTPVNLRDFVADRGWWFGYIGPVRVGYVGKVLPADSFAHHVETVASEIDRRASTDRIGTLLVMPDSRGYKPEYRKAIGDALAKRRDRLKRTSTAFCMVTESLMTRSVLQTIFFFAPPPFPHGVEATTEKGIEFIAKHTPGLDPKAWHAQYLQALPQALAEVARLEEAARIAS